MSVMKKLRKEAKRNQFQQYGAMIRNVNQLVEKNLLRIEKERCAIHIYPQLWREKDAAFINSWCKNLMVYWCIMEKRTTGGLTMDVFNLENQGDLLGKYSISKGFDAA